jgi:hypothetical protein
MSQFLAVVVLVASAVAAQETAENPRWVTQFGTVGHEVVSGMAPDGVGGMFACGATKGSLAGSTAGLDDAWLARFDLEGNEL